GVIIRSQDYGASWSPPLKSQTTTQLRAVWGSGPSDVYAVGATGTIVHSDDGGVTWTARQSGTTSNLWGIWGASSSDIYIVGDPGTARHSEDGGVTWQECTGIPAMAVEGVTGVSQGQVFAAVAGGPGVGAIIQANDGDTSWSTSISSSDYIVGVWA